MVEIVVIPRGKTAGGVEAYGVLSYITAKRAQFSSADLGDHQQANIFFAAAQRARRNLIENGFRDPAKRITFRVSNI